MFFSLDQAVCSVCQPTDTSPNALIGSIACQQGSNILNIDRDFVESTTFIQVTREQPGIFKAKVANCVESAICRYYTNKKLFVSDPLLLNALMQMKPIVWRNNELSLKRISIMSPPMAEMIEQLSLTHILTIPWRINATTVGILRLETSQDSLNFLNEACKATQSPTFIDFDLISHVEKTYGEVIWTEFTISLTKREQDILTLFSFGETIQSVAKYLNRSENTINTHTKRIFDKLGVKNRQQAVSKAHAFGLIDYALSI